MGTSVSGDDRIALIIEAEDRASAAVKNLLTTLESGTQRATRAQNEHNRALDRIPDRKLKSAAAGVIQIADAALVGTNRGLAMANAFGNVAEMMALVTRNARFAAWASGIGVAIQAAVGLLLIFQRIGDEQRKIEQRRFDRMLGRLDIHELARTQRMLEMQRDTLREMERPLAETFAWLDKLHIGFRAVFGLGVARELKLAEERIKQFNQRAEDLREDFVAAEARRQRELNRDLASELRDTTATAYGAFLEQFSTEHQARLQEIEHRRVTQLDQVRQRYKEILDLRGHEQGLTKEQQATYDAIVAMIEKEANLRTKILETQKSLLDAERARTIHLESEHAGERLEGRLREIEAERDAIFRAEGYNAQAAEIAEMRKRKARREAYREAIGSLKTIEDVMVASGSRQVKAIGHVAGSIRRILIGAEGARSAVAALREGAEAFGALARGDFRGAALHGISALEHAKAAALAAQESLGGGRTAGAAGGAGGGPTFEPNRPQGQGAQTIILQTVDPFSNAVISQVAWELERGGQLKRPVVPLPPTTGIRAA